MTQAPVYDDRELDRTPPQDLNAEQSVLGAMLMSKDAISDVVEVLRGVDFYRPNHESIFDAILNLYGRGGPADPITVAGASGSFELNVQVLPPSQRGLWWIGSLTVAVTDGLRGDVAAFDAAIHPIIAELA